MGFDEMDYYIPLFLLSVGLLLISKRIKNEKWRMILQSSIVAFGMTVGFVFSGEGIIVAPFMPILLSVFTRTFIPESFILPLIVWFVIYFVLRRKLRQKKDYDIWLDKLNRGKPT